MKQSNKLLKILWNIEEIILMICLAVMGISLFLQVVFRYLFNMPLIWSEELARYLHVWITFIGLGYGIRNKSHIEMKIFYQKLPVAGQKTVTILTNLFLVLCFVFSGMSGSAVADTGGLGAIELQAMKEAGYDEEFSLAVTGASAIIGPIIPPSIPAVIFGVTSGVSIGRLFAGGVIPGLLMGGAMSAMVYFISKKKKYPKRKRASFKEIFHALKSAFLPLLAPVIIIGGIIGGVFTPTEAAIAAVFYALLLSFIYKEIKITQLPGFLRETLNTTIGILFIISSANLFGWIMTTSQVPQKLAVAFLSVIADKYLALLVLNVFLLLVGCFLETSAAQIILVPILVPMVMKMGVDPVHFGIIMILNLMIGLMTPPIGLVLYVLSSISKVPFEKISEAILPYVLVLGVVLLVITYVPILVTFLPDLLFGN